VRRADVAIPGIFFALGACAAPAAKGMAPPSAAPLPAAAAAASSSPASAPDPLAALRERGPLHAEPLRIPAGGKSPERWLAFLGDTEAATAAWYVAPGDPHHPLTPVDRWPVGVRVLGGAVRDGTPYLLIETVGVLDQPAGLRAVWTDGEPRPSLDGVVDVTELQSRVAALSPRAPASDTVSSPLGDERPVVRALKAAARSDTALARALAPEGARVELVWQRLFRREVERVDAASYPSSPRAKDLLEIARGAAEDEACRGDVCTTETPTGSASVVMALRGGSYVVEGFRLDAPPPPAAIGAPKAVQTSTDGGVTASVLRQHARVTRAVLGEAPLRSSAPGGDTIGVGVADVECDGPVVVIREAGAPRVFPLSAMCMVGATLTDARFEARFADVDGDGRTDAVVRVAGRSNADAAVETSFSEVYLAPPPTVQKDEIGPDHGAELALSGARSVDDAVNAALSVAPRGTTTAEACKVLAGTSQLGNFRRAATADVRVLFFSDPELPTYDARIIPERALEADDVRGSGIDCADLACSATRPFCTSGGGESYYWFAWIAGKMRLAGAAFQAAGE
jgi:hypothetical protein